MKFSKCLDHDYYFKFCTDFTNMKPGLNRQLSDMARSSNYRNIAQNVCVTVICSFSRIVIEMHPMEVPTILGVCTPSL